MKSTCEKCGASKEGPTNINGAVDGFVNFATSDNVHHTLCRNCAKELYEQQLRDLKIGERHVMYVEEHRANYFFYHEVTSWDGFLKIRCRHSEYGCNNFTGGIDRLDVWFVFEGMWFWGKHIGDNDVLYVRKLKRKPRRLG